MQKPLTKPAFGVPSIELARRIDTHDNSTAINAAVYRAESRLTELRSQYETECSRVRTAMLVEIASLELGDDR